MKCDPTPRYNKKGGDSTLKGCETRVNHSFLAVQHASLQLIPL